MEAQVILKEITQITDIREIDFEKLNICLDNSDFLVRCDTVSLLTRFATEKAVADILVKMLLDKCYLVRCEACESLSEVHSIEMLYILLERVKKDKSSTVRMYALSSICKIMKSARYSQNIVDEIIVAYRREKSKRVIISFLTTLYLINKDNKYIQKALYYINDKDYRIRCNVINSVSLVFDDSIKDMVCITYSNRYFIEESIAVKSLLETYIN